MTSAEVWRNVKAVDQHIRTCDFYRHANNTILDENFYDISYEQGLFYLASDVNDMWQKRVSS